MKKKGPWTHAAQKFLDIGICFEPLEPRLLLSGSWDAGLGSPAPGSQPATQADLTPVTASLFERSGSFADSAQHAGEHADRPVDILARAPAVNSSELGEATDSGNPAASNAGTIANPTATHSSTATLEDAEGNNRSALDPEQNRIDITGGRELIFVDTGIQDYRQLVNDLLADRSDGRQIDVIALDTGSNGVQQIGAVLAGRQDIDAVHFVTHGTDRAVKLGDTWLYADNLDAYAGDIAAWKSSLADGADLLFYGCELAGSQDGRSLLAGFRTLTDADVAASIDDTGHARLGGDWDLEYTAGNIEVATAFSSDFKQSWHGLLANLTFQNGVGGYSGTLDTLLDSAAPGSVYGSDAEFELDDNPVMTGLIRFVNIFGAGPGQIPPGSTIVSASLAIDVTGPSLDTANIRLHRMLTDWTEGDTWSSMTGGIQLDDVEARFLADSTLANPDEPGMQTFNGLAATLQAWSDGDPNHGWVIVNDNDQPFKFYSADEAVIGSRPELIVDYIPPSAGMTYNVSTTADGGPGSLRQAIIAANASSGADTIILPAGNYTLTLNGTGEDAAATGDLDITDDLTISGASAANTTIDGNSLDRVFEALSGATLILEDLTITGGSTSDDGGGLLVQNNSAVFFNRVVITGNSAGKSGGGLYLNDAVNATLTDVSLLGNSADSDGGGLYVRDHATASLNSTQIVGNSANRDGGGMRVNNNGNATLIDVSITGNSADNGKGGGLDNRGITNLTNVTISDNSGDQGGGINSEGGGATLDLLNVTISGNTASKEGGGLRNKAPVNITNSTIADNEAVDSGAGIDGDGKSINLKNTIIDDNRLTDLTPENVNAGANISSLGHNIDSDGTAGLSFTGDQSGVNPLLGPLQNNGGPTLTHTLLVGSPAIDPVGLSGAPPVDQRGSFRDGTPDIGAYEYGAVGGSSHQAPVVNDQGFTLDENSASGAPVGTVTATDSGPADNYSMLYWVDVATNELRRINIDGSGSEQLVLQADGSGGAGPRSVAVDDVNGHVYWVNNDSDEIWRANLDGSGEVPVLGGLDAPIGIAVDAAGEKIYWFEATAQQLWWADFNGANAAALVTSGINNPKALAIDAGGGKLYWTDRDNGTVMRADQDGTNVETVVTGLDDPYGIALDSAAGKVYWAEPGLDEIHRADMAVGATAETAVTGLTEPRAVAIDSINGKIYIADAGTDRIERANLNGSFDGIVTATGDWPVAMAIGPPVQNLTYAISGGNPNGAFAIDAATGAITVADSAELDFETTPVFNLAVTVTDAGGLADSATITVNLTDVSDSVQANNDSYSVDEDTTLNIPAPGVLGNDTYSVTGQTAGYDAGQDIDGDGIWQEAGGTGSHDWNLHPSVVRTTTPSTTKPGIEAAYVFDGSGGGTTASLADLPGSPNTDSASFEIWFNPSDALGQEILFETGEDIWGTALSLNGSVLEFTVANGASTTVSADISAEIAADEFIQAVGVLDFAGAKPDIHLYINGTLVDSLISVNGISEWADSDGSGLGQVNGFASTANTGNFIGEIAAFRFYERALSDTEVQTNYNAPNIGNSLAATNLDTTGTAGAVTLNPDGSFTYTPAANWSGVDSFSYTADDGSTSDTATVTITVNPVNDAPTVALSGTTTTMPEDTDTSSRIKVADIVIADDAMGTNDLALSGTDAALFEIDGLELFLSAGVDLYFDTNPVLDVTVEVNDTAVGANPDDTAALSIAITEVIEPVTANNDSFSVDEDTTLNILASGVLANDTGDPTDPLPGHTLNYVANLDADGDTVWEDDNGTSGFNWTLHPSVTRTTNPATSIPGIDAAYVFDGSGGGTIASPFGALPGNPTNNSASFEIWFRPSDTVGTEILFETGGTLNSASLSLNGSVIQFKAQTGGNVGTVSTDLSTRIAAGEFIQIMGVVDMGGTDTDVHLYVDGTLAGSVSGVSNLDDWTGAGVSGLGQVNGSTNTTNTDNFVGEIAAFRFYESALNAAQVNGNYYALTGSTGLTATNLDTAGTQGAVSLNADGGFTYTPTANWSGVDSFSYTADDGNTTDTATVTVTVNPVNDAPVLSTTAASPTFTEDGGPVGLYSGTAVDLIEAGDRVAAIELSVSGLQNGSAERLIVDGTVVGLTDGNSVTTATTSFNVDVTVAGATATVTITRTGDISPGTTQTLVNGLAYENWSNDPGGANRTVTLTSIRDDGGTLDGGQDTSALNIASVVSIIAVNDAPTVSLANTITTFPEDTDTSTRIRVADIVVTDDLMGTNNLTLTGPDAAMFEIDGTELFIRAGVSLNFEFNPGLEVTVAVDDTAVGTTPDDTTTLSISITDVNEPPTAINDNYTIDEDTTLDTNANWFDTDWSFRQTLSFDNLAQSDNLNDFPVLLALDATRIDYAETQNNGADLRFVDGDGNLLAHEIEDWNESGTSYVWVKVPRIEGNSDTDFIWMYYGNGSVGDGQDASAVWSNDYQAVYHLNGDPSSFGTVPDATGNFNGTNNNTDDAPGYIGNAQDFDGNNDYIVMGSNQPFLNNANGATISAWIKADDISSPGILGVSINAGPTDYSRAQLTIDDGDLGMHARSLDSDPFLNIRTTGNPVSVGAWHYLVGVVDYANDEMTVYVDGVEGAKRTSVGFAAPASSSLNSWIGVIGKNENTSSRELDGILDEVRLADSARTADWLTAQYASMTDQFVTYGYQQTVAGVLGNDIDPDGDALTAVLVGPDPANAQSFNLNADGSFTYTPIANFDGVDTFTYRANDGTVDSNLVTVTITVNPVNDAPSGTDNTVSTLEDSDHVFTAAEFGFSDPDDIPADSLAAVKITTLPTAGTLTNNGSAVSTGQFIALADIDNGFLKFTPAPDAAGTGYAGFTFQVQDDGGTADGGVNLDASANTMTVNVTAVNDAPVLSTTAADPTFTEDGGPVTLYSGTAVDPVEAGDRVEALELTVSGLQNGTDERLIVDGTVVGLTDGNSVTTATNSFRVDVTVAGATATLTITRTGDISAGATQTLVDGLAYENLSNDPLGVNRTVTLTSIRDDGGTLDGGQNTSAPNIASIVTITAVNDAPTVTLANTVTTFTENTDTTGRIRVADIVVADDLMGTNDLALIGADATMFEIVGNQLYLKAGETLDFETNPNLDVTVTVNDTAVGSDPDDTATLNITVTDVNEAPAGTDNTVTILEDSDHVFTAAEFGFSDPDDIPADSLAAVKITSLPTAGSLTNNGSAVSAGQLIALADIDNGFLKFTPAPDAAGTGYAGFTFQVQDDGGIADGGINLDASANTMTVNVTAVNDAPVLSTTAANPTFTEDGGPVGLYSGTAIDPVEAGDRVAALELTVSGLQNGSDERLIVDGTTVGLTDGNSVTTATTSFTVDVTVAGATATVTITRTGDISAGATQTLVDGLAYENLSNDPLGVNRTVTLTSIRDDGGTLDGGQNTSAPNIASIVTITAVNDAPTVTLANTVTTFTENTDTTGRIRVADIVVADDLMGTNTLALTGADATMFEIIGTELFLRAGETLNFEANPILDVSVTVNDPALAPNPNDTAALAINITDANEPPTVSLANTTASLAEDTDTSSRIKVADIIITDDAPGTNDLVLGGTDSAMFEIDSNELYLIAGATLNFEANPSLDVTIAVNDASLAPDPNDTAALTIGIIDVNEPPTVSLSNTTTTLAEDISTATRIKVADIVVADDALGARDLALIGTDATMFEIIGAELFLRAGETLDFESNPNLDVSVTVNDPALAPDPNDTAALSIGITDVNEPPTVSLSNTVTTLAEDASTATRIKVADIIVTDDAPGANDLALTGTDAAMFEIVGSELFLRAGTTLNFEGNPDLDVTVTVNDAALAPSPNDTAALTIGITDVNEPPTVSLSNITTTLAEDADTSIPIKVADIIITDDAPGTNDLALGGTDAAMFEIIGTELFLRAGVTLDYEGNSNLDVSVTVNDAALAPSPNDTAALNIGITDVNEPPKVSLNNTTTTLPEDTDTTGPVKVADIVITDDAPGTNDLVLIGTDAALFEIIGTELFLRAGTTLNFEGNPDLDVTVAVNDATLAPDPNDTTALSINIADINEPPTVSLSNTVTTLAEDASTASRIKVADIVIADDAPGTNDLALAGTDATLFEIIGTELFLRAGVTLDYEGNSNLDVSVTVNDAALAPSPNDTAALNIGITDVNEPPTVSLANTTTTLAEDTDTSSRIKVADIVITDDAPGTNDLALGGADAAMFEIIGTELFLRAGSALDYAGNPLLDVTVAVDDTTVGAVPDDTAPLSIAVTDVNTAPTATNLNAAETYLEDTALNLTDIVVTDVDSTDITVTLALSDPAAGHLSTASAGAVTSTYSGGLWTASGAVADVNALLAGVTFTPSANYNGTITLAASASDGVSTPVTGVKIMTGTAVGDTPRVADTATPALTQSALMVIDRNVDDGAEVTHFHITGITNGTLYHADGVTQIHNGDFITYAQGQAGVRFTPTAGSGASGSYTVEASEDGVSVANQSGPATATVGIIVPTENPSDNKDSGGDESEPESPPEESETADQEEETSPETLPEEEVTVPEIPPVTQNAGQSGSITADLRTYLGQVSRELRVAGVESIDLKDIVESLSTREQAGYQSAFSVLAQKLNFRPANAFNAMSAVAYEYLQNSLDEMKDEMNNELGLNRTLVGSAIAMSTGLSVGYVVWLLRSGMLLSSLLSSMPAWRILDPLPILAGRRDDSEPDDEESLETLLKKKPDDADKADTNSDPSPGVERTNR